MWGSLGMGWYAKRGYQRMTLKMDRKLRQIKRRGFLQIRDSFLDGFTLGSGTSFWVQRDIAAFFGGSKYCGQFHYEFLSESAIVARFSAYGAQRSRSRGYVALSSNDPCTAGSGTSSAMTSFGMQLQPKCTDDFKDGVEVRATITGERFVKTFARQSGIARDL